MVEGNGIANCEDDNGNDGSGMEKHGELEELGEEEEEEEDDDDDGDGDEEDNDAVAVAATVAATVEDDSDDVVAAEGEVLRFLRRVEVVAFELAEMEGGRGANENEVKPDEGSPANPNVVVVFKRGPLFAAH